MQESPVFGVGTAADQESGTAAERDPESTSADAPFDFPDMRICGTARAWIRMHRDDSPPSPDEQSADGQSPDGQPAGPESTEPTDAP